MTDIVARKLCTWTGMTLFVLVTAALATGCHVHRAADLETLSPGDEVRVVLTSDGRDRLRELSPRIVEELDGRLVSVGGDSLTVERPLDRGQRASPAGPVRQRLTVAHSEVREIRTPELHRARTILMSAGVVAVTGMVLSTFLDWEGGGSAPPDSPRPPSPTVVPW